MSKFRPIICDDCGETGRDKEVLRLVEVRGEDPDWVIDMAYYCHDEEKSCYNYVLFHKVDLLG